MPLTSARLVRIRPYALKFDGVNDYVKARQPKIEQVSAMVWVMPTGMPTGWNIIMRNPYTSPRYPYYTWNFNFYSNTLRVIAGVSHSSGNYATITDPNPLSLNTWYFLALTYDVQALKYYKNGVLIDSKPFNYSLEYWTDEVSIGYAWNSYFFTGLIAEALIYSRALSDSEIQWNYNYPDNPVRSGLIMWLPGLDEYITSTQWLDKSGFGNNGTIYGATKTQVIKSAVRSQAKIRVLSAVR